MQKMNLDRKGFDLKAEYAAEVDPLMDQLLGACDRLGMPAVVVVCYGTRGEDGDYAVGEASRDGWSSPVVRGIVRSLAGRDSIATEERRDP